MKPISDKDLCDRWAATENALAHLRTTTSHRRHQYPNSIHNVGDPFLRDYSVIKSSKGWRRGMLKNQVATTRCKSHLRCRASHVCEVGAHSERVASHLGLNVFLAQAIAAGHDIGHVPFGHQGEHYLQDRVKMKFTHEVMGVIVAQKIERKGRGLNLTHATLDGMWRHSGNNACLEMTQEAWVVNICDKIAYLWADLNDFKRLTWTCSKEVYDVAADFGPSQRHRTFRTMLALCEESAVTGRVKFEDSEEAILFNHFRKLMYKEYDKLVEQKVGRFLDPIYDFLERSEKIPPWLGIALLTDAEVCAIHTNPDLLSWSHIDTTGLGEIINLMDHPHLFDPNLYRLDLDW